MLRHQLAAVQKAWGVPKEIEVGRYVGKVVTLQ